MGRGLRFCTPILFLPEPPALTERLAVLCTWVYGLGVEHPAAAWGAHVQIQSKIKRYCARKGELGHMTLEGQHGGCRFRHPGDLLGAKSGINCTSKELRPFCRHECAGLCLCPITLTIHLSLCPSVLICTKKVHISVFKKPVLRPVLAEAARWQGSRSGHEPCWGVMEQQLPPQWREAFALLLTAQSRAALNFGLPPALCWVSSLGGGGIWGGGQCLPAGGGLQGGPVSRAQGPPGLPGAGGANRLPDFPPEQPTRMQESGVGWV